MPGKFNKNTFVEIHTKIINIYVIDETYNELMTENDFHQFYIWYLILFFWDDTF